MRVNKQPGEKWLVMLRQGGGQLEVAEKDDAVFDSDEGLIIYHNDGGKTVTFAPKEGIGYIRAYTPKGGGGFSNMRSQDGLGRAPSIPGPSVRVIDAEGARELEPGDGEDVDAPEVWPCPECSHANVVHRENGCVVCPCERVYADALDE